MARTIEKLSPVKVAKLKRRGLYGDGGGLYLNIGPTGGKSWVYRYMIDGRARTMGLGPLHTIGIAEARQRALEARKARLYGTDPLEARHAGRRARKVEAAKAITFKQAANKYIQANKSGWRNKKHGAQWSATLETYCHPVIGALPVNDIDTGHVTRILEPIWSEKTETAGRVRGRIEAVLDYAKVHGWREGENLARWKGHLENVLPKKSKVAKVEHHAALPWKEIGSFVAELRKQNGTAARALEFTILTAARTNETIAATWDEIDMKAKVWTIPAVRMKAGQEHRIPLCDDALSVLKEAAKLGDEDYIFKSGKGGLSNMAMLKLVQDSNRMNRPGVTVHGFRSTFRDWAAETGRPSDIAEAALAHTPGSKVIQAYQRGDLLDDRRRALMAQWAAFCAAPFAAESGNVVGLHGGAA